MRTTRKTNRYDASFRQDAVGLVNRSDRPLGELASSLGVPKGTLYFWWRESMAKSKKKTKAETRAREASAAEAPLSHPNSASAPAVASLEEDKDILKKFAAFSVREKT